MVQTTGVYGLIFNNDKEFDSSELVVQKASTGTVYGYFTLPRNLSKGFHRVRVSMKQGSYADSCDKFDVGEVEDYLLLCKILSKYFI